MYGKTVRIFLVDGSSHGIMTSEIMNWTGQITVTPRSKLSEFSKRKDSSRTGVYILVGEDTENPAQTKIYIGESDNILTRLQYHNQDQNKDFWNQTIIITSKDDNLTKSHVRYLESRLIQIIGKSKFVSLSNGTSPDASPLPESDIADMEYFLEQIQLLLPVLGFQFATPLPTISQKSSSTFITQDSDSSSPIFEMKYTDAYAQAQEVGDKFVVLKGSIARKSHTKSFPAPFIQIRATLKKNGSLVDHTDPKTWIFADDVPFSSPSAAAKVVGGASLNGRDVWKEKTTQKTYKEWLEAQI